MIFKRFFKPKWQHNDAAVRQQAIAQLDQQNQEHKSILHELAFNDGAEAVRKAALLKLNDFSLWWQASKHDSAERLQQLAEQTLIEQLLQNKVEAKLKLQFIAQCNRSSILEQLAQTETDAGIKFSLLQRLNKAELNYKALQEPVLQLAQKRQLLAGLTDEKVLEKLARQLDGELQTEVLQKLQALHEQKQKPPQLRKQLTLLLAKLNALRERTALEQIPAQLEEYQAQWLQLEPELECLAQEAQEFRTKYEKIISQLQQWLAPKLAQLNEIQAQQQRETKQRAAYQALQQQVDALKQGLQQALLNADISAAQQLESHLQAVEQALAEADVADKTALTKQVQQLQQQLQQLPALADQLAQLTRLVADWAAQKVPSTVEEYQSLAAQLSQWQQDWRRLSKALVIAVPDSLQQAKDDLARQWQNAAVGFTAQSEKVQRQCRSKLAQYRRLYSAGKYKVLFGLFKGIEQDYAQLTASQQQALGKDYEFASEKMAELADWQEYIATPRKQQLLAQMQALSAELPDNLIRQRADEVKQARAQWNSLGKADPALEQQLNDDFDAACERAFAPCRSYFAAQDALRTEHVKQREQLIASAQAIQPEQLDAKTLEQQLHQLKQAWQQAGAVDKQQFNALNDAFTQALAPSREHLTAIQQQVAQAKQQLIVKAQSALALNDANLTAKALKECQQQWKQLGQAARKQDQALWTEFRAVCDSFFNARAEQALQQKAAEQAELEQITLQLNALDALLQQADSAAEFSALQQKLQAIETHSVGAQQSVRQLQSKLQQAQQQWLLQQNTQEFAAMFELLQDPAVSAEQLPAAYRDVFAKQQEQQFSREQLTLALEIVTDMPSPDQAARQQVQLLLLSDKHNQGVALDKHSLLRRWLQFGAVQAKELPLLQRVKAVFA